MIKATAKPNEWSGVLVLNVMSRSKLRIAELVDLSTSGVTALRIWRLTSDRCPRGVLKKDIGDLADESEDGEFDPDEVKGLIAKHRKAIKAAVTAAAGDAAKVQVSPLVAAPLMGLGGDASATAHASC